MNLLGSKKGILRSATVAAFAVFAIALTFLVAATIHKEADNQLQTLPYYTSQVGDLMDSYYNTYRILDYLMILIVIALVIGIAVSSLKVASNPVYFAIVFLLTPILAAVCYSLSYIFIQFASNSYFTSVVSIFPRTIFFSSNLHWIFLIEIAVGSITMYGKISKGQEGKMIETIPTWKGPPPTITPEMQPDYDSSFSYQEEVLEDE